MYCPHCGKEVTEGQPFCHLCGGKIAPDPEQDAVRMKTPWEDRGSRGFLGGFLATLRESLFRPGVFFRKMPVTGGLADPLLYALITSMVGFMVSYVWQILLRDAMHGYLPDRLQGAGGFDLFGGLGLAVFALLMPFFVIMALFLWSGILHALLLLVKGATNGFEATFRTVAYSYGANLFLAIPFCGSIVAPLWGMVLVIVGLREAHGISGSKASFAVLFPLLLCCIGVFLVALLIFGTIAASLGSLSQQPWK